MGRFDTRHICHAFEPYSVDVEKGALRLFAKAIGETNPINTDETAARAAGYRSIVAPLTYVSCLQGLAPRYFPVAGLLGFDESEALHGEQAFEYRAPICAGDRLTLQERIVDIFDKKEGALNFVVSSTEVRDQGGAVLAVSRETLMVRSA